MKIRIEKREVNSKGQQTLRLVYDLGPQGSNKQFRKKESLTLFLYKDPKTTKQRHHNKEHSRLAEAIKSKRIVEYTQGKWDIGDTTKLKASFFDWYQKLTDEKSSGSKSNYSIWVSSLKHLRKYHNQPQLSFEQVTVEFLEGFREYLLTEPLTKSNTLLASNTASTYFNKIRAALNKAYTKGIIRNNPVQQVTCIKPTQNKREYLTIEEIKILAKTDCRYDVTKRAFLFSCLTGLRWSDANKLIWSEVHDFDGGKRVIFKQKKTKGVQYLDINNEAFNLLGVEGKPDDRVFIGLRYSSYNNVAMERWAMDAGINKHITFHVSRHTFAVLQLTNGADIYTVSKLLGHSEIKTTQIYADIIDKTRKDAMTTLPSIY